MTTSRRTGRFYRPPSDSSESERSPTPNTDDPDLLSRSFLGGEPTEQLTTFGAIDFLWRAPTTQPEQVPETSGTRE